MVGVMHGTLGRVIVAMHKERSIPSLGPTKSDLLWMDESDIQILEYESLVSYSIESQGSYSTRSQLS